MPSDVPLRFTKVKVIFPYRWRGAVSQRSHYGAPFITVCCFSRFTFPSSRCEENEILYAEDKT